MSLTDLERERYSRQSQLKDVGESGQLKLKSSRVLVVGTGGLGCPVLQYLVAAGIGKIGVMDFDTVTASNLHRQILFSNADVGKSKAICAAQHLRNLNPLIIIEAINEKLTPRNIRNIFSDYDIVIDGTDNFETRYLINDGCVLSGIPYVFGSIYHWNGQVAIFNSLLPDGTTSSNYRDLYPASPFKEQGADCQVGGVMGSVAGIIGTYMATETIKLITGTGQTIAGKLMLVDTKTPEFTLIAIPSRESGIENNPRSWNELENYDYSFGCNSNHLKLEISAATLLEWQENKIHLQVIDIREEWETGDPEGIEFLKIPLHDLKKNIALLDSKLTTIVICSTGKRSILGVNVLKEAGFSNVVSLTGGISSWRTLQKV